MKKRTKIAFVAIFLSSILINAPILFSAGQNIPGGIADFSGQWQTNYGPMRLRQNGYQVEGEYYPAYNGSLKGSVNGNVLDFKWKEGVFMKGSGRFTIALDRKSFSGGWGESA